MLLKSEIVSWLVVSRGCISSSEELVLRNLMTKNSSWRKQAKKSKNWAVKMNGFFHEIVIRIEDFRHLFTLRFQVLIKCSIALMCHRLWSDCKQKPVQSKLFDEQELGFFTSSIYTWTSYALWRFFGEKPWEFKLVNKLWNKYSFG